MSSINVISIDPAQSAKPALHPEVFERIARECRFTRDVTTFNLSAVKFINLFFGITKRTSRSRSLTLLAIRTLSAAALITGFFLFDSMVGGVSTSLMMIILGVSLFFGLFNRVISTPVAAFFSIMAISFANVNGVLDPIAIGGAIIAIAFTITGPGKFSIDQIIRRGMIRYSKKRAKAKAEKLASLRLSYKAMQYV